MRHGFFIPAAVVRLALGALTALVVAVVVAEAPEVKRYLKLKSM